MILGRAREHGTGRRESRIGITQRGCPASRTVSSKQNVGRCSGGANQGPCYFQSILCVILKNKTEQT